MEGGGKAAVSTKGRNKQEQLKWIKRINEGIKKPFNARITTSCAFHITKENLYAGRGRQKQYNVSVCERLTGVKTTSDRNIMCLSPSLCPLRLQRYNGIWLEKKPPAAYILVQTSNISSAVADRKPQKRVFFTGEVINLKMKLISATHLKWYSDSIYISSYYSCFFIVETKSSPHKLMCVLVVI